MAGAAILAPCLRRFVAAPHPGCVDAFATRRQLPLAQRHAPLPRWWRMVVAVRGQRERRDNMQRLIDVHHNLQPRRASP